MLQANGIAPRPTPPLKEDDTSPSEHQTSPKVPESVDTTTKRSASSEVKEDGDEESEEEETEQIIIKSLRTLLVGVHAI